MDEADLRAKITEELGDAIGFLEVVYREMCENHAETMQDLQDRNVSDSEELLRTMSCFEETKFLHYLNAEAPVLRKNAKRSSQLREQGNKAYTSKKNSQALKLYTESVRFAPYSDRGVGEELCMAYANRSAVLAQGQQWNLALQDIQLSVEAGYPKDLAYKLHERRAKCFTGLGQHTAAGSSYQEALTSLADAKLDAEKKEKLEQGFRNSLNQVPSKDSANAKSSILDESEDLPKIARTNPRFPAFSDAIDLKTESGRGRFGVTTRPVALGELLAVERPPVFFLHEETSGINCSHCFRESAAPLPSPTCTQTVFCSRRCQDEAMATYHVTESKFMDVLFQHGLRKKEWFLALRAVTMKSLAYFLEQGIGEHDPGYGTKDGVVYDGQDFKSLYNLVSHHSEWSFKEHAYKAFFSLFFVRCLQKSNYFGEHQSKEGVGELNKEELLIGTLMIHIMEVATMNAHEIGQMEVEGETNWLLAQTKPVGCALEPTLVLLNHSCDPTLLRVNIGTATLCFASRDLAAGEEVTDCYSQAYDSIPFVERHPDLLSKYKFDCRCRACKDQWETFHQLPRSFNDVPADKMMSINPENASQLQGKMMLVQKLGSTINQLQQKEDFEGSMALYSKFQAACLQLLSPPHQFFTIARRSYATCLWIKYGNKVRRRQ